MPKQPMTNQATKRWLTCLVTKEDDINEVYLESNFFNDLQDDYIDLYEESLKMINKNYMLRK